MTEKLATQELVGRDQNLLEKLNKVMNPAERAAIRQELQGKVVELSGTASWKFWDCGGKSFKRPEVVGTFTKPRRVEPDYELLEFTNAEIQILDVIFMGEDGLPHEPTMIDLYYDDPTGSFLILFEARVEHDSQQIPRLVHKNDLTKLVDHFPLPLEDALPIEAYREVAKRLFT